MSDSNILSVFTQKVGPLPGWGWAGIVGVSALALMTFAGKKKAAKGTSGATGATGPGGEFSSTQSQESIDPVTGERRSSQYQATGPTTGGWGGGVGLPMAYPMPYSGGDVFVNLPGDTPNLKPAQPITGLHYPPKIAPGPGKGQVGGYWWTPLNDEDAGNFGMRSGLALNPNSNGPAITRIMIANPQIDWTKGDTRALIGVPLYIPQATIGAAGTPHNEPPWPMPPNASLYAPEGYNPPVQQTTVSSG